MDLIVALPARHGRRQRGRDATALKIFRGPSALRALEAAWNRLATGFLVFTTKCRK
jgi:hypothetical protein